MADVAVLLLARHFYGIASGGVFCVRTLQWRTDEVVCTSLLIILLRCAPVSVFSFGPVYHLVSESDGVFGLADCDTDLHLILLLQHNDKCPHLQSGSNHEHVVDVAYGSDALYCLVVDDPGTRHRTKTRLPQGVSKLCSRVFRAVWLP